MGTFQNTASMDRIVFSIFYYLDLEDGKNNLIPFYAELLTLPARYKQK